MTGLADGFWGKFKEHRFAVRRGIALLIFHTNEKKNQNLNWGIFPSNAISKLLSLPSIFSFLVFLFNVHFNVRELLDIRLSIFPIH